MCNFPLVFRRNNQNYQIFCEIKTLSYLWTNIFLMCCTAFVFFCLFNWLVFSCYIICSLKSYLTSFTMVILTIIFSLQGWVCSVGLKSIPVLDISAPSLLPTLNSGIYPRNQSCLIKFCWIKSRTQNNDFYVCIWFLALEF